MSTEVNKTKDQVYYNEFLSCIVVCVVTTIFLIQPILLKS